MGGKTTSTTATKIDGLSVQSSSLGLPLAIGWGRNRVTPNLIWYDAFTAIPHTTTTKAGKGLGGSSSNTTYTYTASIILAIGDGPLNTILTVYKDQAPTTNLPDGETAIGRSGFSVFGTGALDQPVWGYLTSSFPGQALAYSGISYVGGSNYDLGDSGSLPNHTFEVVWPIFVSGAINDANPRDVVVDFLTNSYHGVPGWASGLIGSTDDYANYCTASGLFLSPLIDAQRQASDFLTEVTDATNTDLFWSEGVLKLKPRGDDVISANGVTWAPDLTPIYDLDEDDFCPDTGNPAVTLNIQDQSDAYNIIQVEYLDRDNQYNTAIAQAQDLANIDTYGRRKQDPTSWHSICDGSIAMQAAQLLLQRTLYIRAQYVFRLPWEFVLLEPADYVTLTTTSDGLQLDRQLVRIIEIDEDEDGFFTVTAEEVPVGIASAALYPAHTASGYAPNKEVAPGSVSSPVLINAPTSLTGSDPEVWCAAASTSEFWGGCQVWISVDGDSYTMVGTINGPARYGSLTSALAASPDPDNTNTISVDLSPSLGDLLGGTAAEMNAAATLSLVGSELVAYENANLTAAYHYGLQPLRRGLYGSVISSHPAGERFVRLDDAVFKFSYTGLNVGSTIYVKLPSFNIYGRAVEDLSAVTVYSVSLLPTPTLPSDATTPIEVDWGAQLDMTTSALDRVTSYRWEVYKSDATTLLRTVGTLVPSFGYTSAQAEQDGIQRAYYVKVYGVGDAGLGVGSESALMTNPAPPAVTSAAISGGTTTATATCDASTDPDLAGYALFYSNTSGFNPAISGGVITSGIPSISIFGLEAGTYFGRICAYDSWSLDPNILNLSSEISFTITSGGGSTPSGGGSGGGGYEGACPEVSELILLANETLDGPGEQIAAGNLVAGKHWVWTQHEHTRAWGAYPVVHAETVASDIWSADGHPKTSPSHRFWINGWTRMDAFGAPYGRGEVVVITINDAHTYVCGGRLSHNKRVSV